MEIWLSSVSPEDSGIRKAFWRALSLYIPLEECIKNLRGQNSQEKKLIILEKMINKKTGSCVK